MALGAKGSQFGEDTWIIENLTLPKKGFYLDIGAGNPIRFSNTYLLHKMGWKGLCIDGDMRQVKKLRDHNRDAMHAVITKRKKEIVFYEYQEPDLSGVQEMVGSEIGLSKLRRVITTPISVVASKIPSKIDYLSLDIEGAELEVLEGMVEIGMYPKIMIVEHTTTGRPDISDQILKLVRAMGYRLVHKTKANFILVKEL